MRGLSLLLIAVPIGASSIFRGTTQQNIDERLGRRGRGLRWRPRNLVSLLEELAKLENETDTGVAGSAAASEGWEYEFSAFGMGSSDEDSKDEDGGRGMGGMSGDDSGGGGMGMGMMGSSPVSASTSPIFASTSPAFASATPVFSPRPTPPPGGPLVTPVPTPLPTAPPVARPTAPPVAPPTAPPFAPIPVVPVEIPTAPPVTPPTAPPVAPPTAPPVAPPTTPPVAPPTAAPVAPPIAFPSCNVCGGDLIMTMPDAIFMFPNVPDTRCGDLAAQGENGQLFPGDCDALPSLIAETCGCEVDGACSVCGDGLMVTIPDAVFEFPGQPAVPCGTLETAGEQGLIGPSECPFLPNIIITLCGCEAGIPGACSICGEGLEVGAPDAIFEFPNVPPVACGELESLGAMGQLDPRDCQALPDVLDGSVCNCSPV